MMNQHVEVKAGRGRDFRDAAVAESEALLAAGAAPRPVAAPGVPGARDSGYSLCLVADPAGRRIVLRRAVIELLLTVVPVGMMLGGIAVSAVDPAGAGVVMVAGGVAAAAGTTVLFWRLRRWSGAKAGQLRRLIGERPDAFVRDEAGVAARPVSLDICGPGVHLAPRDECLLMLDGANRRLVMEGLSHRYVIYAEDLVDLRAVDSGGEVGFEVEYRVGGETLGLQVTEQSLGTHLKAALHGKPKNELVEAVRGALFRRAGR